MKLHCLYRSTLAGLLSITCAAILSSCDMRVLNDEVAISAPRATTPEGTVLAVSGMIKTALNAHDEMCWASGLVGEQEFSPNRQNIGFVFAVRISNENTIAADNSQNSTIVTAVYSAFALCDVVEQGIERNTFSSNSGQDAKAKALMSANMLMIRGLLYSDLAKFYSEIREPKTNAKLTPDQAKTRAIELLLQARAKWAEYYANPSPLPSGFSPAGMFGVRAGAGGTFLPDSAAVRKFVNSFIGMIHFDQGTRQQAAPFLAAGYLPSDAGQELTYQTIDALTGPGIYPRVRNYYAFQNLNSYSASFIANRIPADTNRRAPSNWFSPVAVSPANYFFPPAARYPLITAQEVALMQAELGIRPRAEVIAQVLQSWRIPAAVATTLANDPAITLERVARYEYVGRGRRWSVGNPSTGQPWPRWQPSLEMNIGS
ncbi:MAG: hypothetical protein RML40_01700 [Bacteroidota bacterium]|nr:hypothetical protein [Candidatus Kapabacteria bacterium]MDW8219223.1 hypothetical protein [Bacteroidota bacterium]